MTEQEKRQAELAAKYEGGNLGTDAGVAGDKKKNRERAASEWINHYLGVVKYVNQAKEDGVVIKSEAELKAYIVAQWEHTSSDKDDAIASLFAA